MHLAGHGFVDFVAGKGKFTHAEPLLFQTGHQLGFGVGRTGFQELSCYKPQDSS
jgi:hypothetical protein